METTQKTPMTKAAIYRLMLTLVYVVSTCYLLKDLIGSSVNEAMIIGGCLLVFTAVLLVLHRLKVQAAKKQMTVSLGLVVLVFLISISSGEYYSDDYCLYIAVMGLSALYMEPFITKVQSIVMPILLVIQYLLHPEKVESRSQFIMCLAIFSLAAYVMYLLVKRGSAFIGISEARANQAEELTASMKAVGAELHKGMQHTKDKYQELDALNSTLIQNAEDLRKGSDGITKGTCEVVSSCDDVQVRIKQTEEQIASLNEEVSQCEDAIRDSNVSLKEMNVQIQTVQRTIHATNEVFGMLESRMDEIFTVLEELNKITSSTTILALNASIEAARAGQAGAGFAVVASNVQELAVNSTACSKRVDTVLHMMQKQVNETTQQLDESTKAVENTDISVKELENKFGELMKRFHKLYRDIDLQNENIHHVETIFEGLSSKISGMNEYSEQNRDIVTIIAASMDTYQQSVQNVVEESKNVSMLSESMLQEAIAE